MIVAPELAASTALFIVVYAHPLLQTVFGAAQLGAANAKQPTVAAMQAVRPFLSLIDPLRDKVPPPNFAATRILRVSGPRVSKLFLMQTLESTRTLLLSVDYEDWHQLVRRRLGARGSERAGPALGRQTAAMLSLLDELGVRATFFVLGMAARSHPELIAAIAERGHEIACHGDGHRPVHAMSPEELRADLRAARATIESLSGAVPIGYRAPAFSLTQSARWAFEVLAEEGFAYDSSQHDSPRIRGRIRSARPGPHRIELARGRTLWELPPAVWRPAGARVPVGGASYWALMPTRLVLHGLAGAGERAGLYLHPHEFDPQPLSAELEPSEPWSRRAHARIRERQRDGARRRAPELLRAIAARHRLITYGEAYAELSVGAGAGP